MGTKYEYDRSNDTPDTMSLTDAILAEQEKQNIIQQLSDSMSRKAAFGSSAGNSASEIASRERSIAQSNRGPYRVGAGRSASERWDGGGGAVMAPIRGILSESIKELGDPEALRALAGGALNWGKGATGALESNDRLKQALSGGLGYDGGFNINSMRKTGPTTYGSAGFGTKQTFNPGMKRYNEHEQRARDARQREFERGQRGLDEALSLRYEQLRREQLLKTLQKFLSRRGYSGNTRTATTEGQELSSVGGLPVRIPTQTKVVEQMPIPWESILSLLR